MKKITDARGKDETQGPDPACREVETYPGGVVEVQVLGWAAGGCREGLSICKYVHTQHLLRYPAVFYATIQHSVA